MDLAIGLCTPPPCAIVQGHALRALIITACFAVATTTLIIAIKKLTSSASTQKKKAITYFVVSGILFAYAFLRHNFPYWVSPRTEAIYAYNEHNWPRAVQLLTPLAESGDSLSKYLLGKTYEEASSLRAMKRAVEWYLRAAEQGDPNGEEEVGLCFLTGRGVEKNGAEAVKWLTESANHGNYNAAITLGDIYEHGREIKKDYAEAYYWFGIASKIWNRNATPESYSPNIRQKILLDDDKRIQQRIGEWIQKPVPKSSLLWEVFESI